MKHLYRIGQAAKLLGVSTTTLRRWIYAGKVKAVRTQGGHFRIPESEVKRLLGGAEEVRAAIYARVSSRDQLDDLDRQVERLQDYCSARGYRVVATITDVASGLNENRRGLNRLFKLVMEGEIDVVTITYRDRLTRFGFRYLERLFRGYGVRIDVVLGETPRDARQELVEDLIAIVASFAGRLYGMRSRKAREVTKAVRELFS